MNLGKVNMTRPRAGRAAGVVVGTAVLCAAVACGARTTADKSLKVFIVVDSEGPSGIAGYWAHDPRDPFCAEKRQLLMGDVNAAVEGCLAAGATEVVVSDDTKFGVNTIPELIHPEAKLITGRGFGSPVPMLQGVDSSFAGVILVGTHAKEGTPDGVLAHTFTGASGKHRRYWYNGQEIGEIAIYAAAAGHLGLPIIMVAGCEATCREARELLGNDLVTVAVKKGFNPGRALLLAPKKTRVMIAAGAKEAVTHARRMKPYRVKLPITVRVQFPNKEFADEYESNHRRKDPKWPARRIDDRTLEGTMTSPVDIIM